MYVRKILSLVAASAVCFASACLPSTVVAQTVSDDLGIDLEVAFPVLLAAIGGVLVLVIGGWFAFLIVKKGMTWIRRYTG